MLHVVTDQDSVQMLQRSTQIGEFYRMHPPPVWDKSRKLPPTYMDILIYDEEADKHQHIQFGTALSAAAAPFASDANAKRFLNALGFKEGVDGGVNALTADNLQKDFGSDVAVKVNNGVPGEEDYKDIRQDKVENAISDILTNVNNGIWLPLCIVIARPFIEHLAMSAIMTVSGRDTGATLFGPAGTRLHTPSNFFDW